MSFHSNLVDPGDEALLQFLERNEGMRRFVLSLADVKPRQNTDGADRPRLSGAMLKCIVDETLEFLTSVAECIVELDDNNNPDEEKRLDTRQRPETKAEVRAIVDLMWEELTGAADPADPADPDSA